MCGQTVLVHCPALLRGNFDIAQAIALVSRHFVSSLAKTLFVLQKNPRKDPVHPIGISTVGKSVISLSEVFKLRYWQHKAMMLRCSLHRADQR